MAMSRIILVLAMCLCSASTFSQWQSPVWEKAGRLGITTGQTRYMFSDGENAFVSIIGDNDLRGFYRSDEAGTTWTRLNDWHILAMAADNGKLYAGGYSGRLFISYDHGISWQQLNSEPFYSYITSIAIYNGQLMVCSSDIFDGPDYRAGTFVSNDNGLTWEGPYSLDLTIIEMIQSGPDLFGIGQFYDLFKFSNEEWSRVLSMSGRDVTSLYADEDKLWAGTDNGIYLSTDNGAHWTLKALAGEHVGYFSGNDSVLVVSAGYVYVSTDNGETWSAPDMSYEMKYAYAITRHNDSFLSGSGDNGIHISTDNAQSWTPVMLGPHDFVVTALYTNTNELVAGTSRGYIFTSDDYATTWVRRTNGFPADSSLQLALTSIDKSSDILLASFDGMGIYWSDDNGRNWTKAGLDNSLDEVLSIKATYWVKVLGGTRNGVILSSDHGKNWSLLYDPGYEIYAVAGMSGMPWHSYAATDIFIWQTKDLGVTWERKQPFIDGQLSLLVKGDKLFVGEDKEVIRFDAEEMNHSIRTVLGAPVRSLITDGENVFAGTYGKGVFLSTDNGVTWQPINQSLDEKRINALAIKADTLYAATKDGVWRTILPWNLGIQRAKTLNFDVYPNPAEDVINIEIDSHQAAVKTLISVINMQGQVIMQQQATGTRTTIGLKNLTAGMYLIRIQSDTEIGSKRVVVTE